MSTGTCLIRIGWDITGDFWNNRTNYSFLTGAFYKQKTGTIKSGYSNDGAGQTIYFDSSCVVPSSKENIAIEFPVVCLIRLLWDITGKQTHVTVHTGTSGTQKSVGSGAFKGEASGRVYGWSGSSRWCNNLELSFDASRIVPCSFESIPATEIVKSLLRVSWAREKSHKWMVLLQILMRQPCYY